MREIQTGGPGRILRIRLSADSPAGLDNTCKYSLLKVENRKKNNDAEGVNRFLQLCSGETDCGCVVV